MEELRALGGGLHLAVGAVVGCRLLRRASRHEVVPELLLGLAFVCAVALGAPLEMGGSAAGRASASAWAGTALAAGKLLTLVGLAAYVCFTWRVFRPHDAWAGPAATAVIALQLVAFLGFAYEGAFVSGRAEGGFYWLELGARAAVPAWACAEALRARAMLLRRALLGLEADPLVPNRLALWAVVAAAGLAMLGASSLPHLVGPEHPLRGVGVEQILYLASALTASLATWLCFFPPAWYRRWLEEQAGAGAAQERASVSAA
jgi:hypothetical protein